MAQKIAYIMSRFPLITETFILYEILELQRLGMQIEIFPLVYHAEGIRHPEVAQLASQVHPFGTMSRELWRSQLYWLIKNPFGYVSSWWQAIRGNLRSPKFLSRALVTVPMAAAFARKIEQLGIERIHAHWATHPTLAAYVINRLTGLPYSFTTHAHDIFVERPMLDEKIRRSDFVVTISDYNKRFLEGLYGKMATDKIVVVRCGIAPDIFLPPKERKNERFTIITVASLEEKKGHAFLIAAYAKLKEQGVDFRALFIGDGDARSHVESLIAAHDLEEHIQLLGRQPRSRVVELVSAADLMVLPSITTSKGKKEGIPVSLMEALAVELPAIATDISGIPELIRNGKTGLLVPEKDADALCEALMLLHDAPELRRQMGQAGRALVIDEFNLYRNTAKLQELLQENRANVRKAALATSSSKGKDA